MNQKNKLLAGTIIIGMAILAAAVATDTIQSTGVGKIVTANVLWVLPSGDDDDGWQFLTTGNSPYQKVIGGGTSYLNNDQSNAFYRFDALPAQMDLYMKADGGSYLYLELINTTGVGSIVTTVGDIVLDPAGNNVNPGGDNQDDLGTSAALAWRSGWITNAWSVGDIVFNFGTTNTTNGTNYRIVEAEKITNYKLKGLMYVMNDKAVMWVEPNGKLHITQEIDTTWEGISGLSFDDATGGVYKDGMVIRYPQVGSEDRLPLDYVDNKPEYGGNNLINKVTKKPMREEINEFKNHNIK
jgi:hypothetical protein